MPIGQATPRECQQHGQAEGDPREPHKTHRCSKLTQPETPEDLPHPGGETHGGSHDKKGGHRPGDQGSVGWTLGAVETPPAGLLRFPDGEQKRHSGDRRGHAPEQEDGVERRPAVAASQRVQRHGQRGARGETAELRGRQPAVGLAAGGLGRDVGDEGFAGRHDGRSSDALEQPE